MRTISVIGIGPGDPGHLTLQAIEQMNRAEVFFTFDKGDEKAELAAFRAELLERHMRGPYRVVELPDPARDRAPRDYEGAVRDWLAVRAELYDRTITAQLPDGGHGAVLTWGDPALYDSTLRLLDGLDVAVVSVPGISSIQVLAARHRIVLNRIGKPFLVTTGRRLAATGMPPGIGDVVVMLDGQEAFAALPAADLDIYWGACLGTPDEVLVSGDLGEVRERIRKVRAELRARKGWVMDVYLLRRRE